MSKTVTASAQQVMRRMRDLGGLYWVECLPHERRLVGSLARRGLVDLDHGGHTCWCFASLSDDGKATLAAADLAPRVTS